MSIPTVQPTPIFVGGRIASRRFQLGGHQPESEKAVRLLWQWVCLASAVFMFLKPDEHILSDANVENIVSTK